MPLRAIVFDLWGTLLIERRGVFPQRAQMRFEGAARSSPGTASTRRSRSSPSVTAHP